MSNIMHPRTLIRHALVDSLAENKEVSLLFGDRIYPNRAEHWLQNELPACGVYMLEEEVIANDIWPKPDERRITLVIEVLGRLGEAVDDVLDRYCMVIESALLLDTIGKNMGHIVDQALLKQGCQPLEYIEKQGVLRHPSDTLLSLTHTNTEIGIAVDANREIGVASMSFTLEYAMEFIDGRSVIFIGGPSSSSSLTAESLPQLLQSISGWDVEEADGLIEMVSQVDVEKIPQNPPQKQGDFADITKQLDKSLKE